MKKNSNDYIGTCWVTTALSCLLFFILVLLLLSNITTSGHRIPRCIPKDELTNRTVHLVHSHDPNQMEGPEVDLFEKIVQNYPDYNIHLIIIQKPDTKPRRLPKHDRNILLEYKTSEGSTEIDTTTYKTNLEKAKERIIIKTHEDLSRRKRKIDEMQLNINMGAKRLLDILLGGRSKSSREPDKPVRSSRSMTKTADLKPTPRKIEDLLQIHPHVIFENTTFNQVFYVSPLYAYWPYLNDNLKIFAVRVLQLWQYGGISFDLEPVLGGTTMTKATTIDLKPESSTEQLAENLFNKKLLNFIISERMNYEKLPIGVVTADDEGMHMESKIPCHAFFGEIITNLRRAQSNTSVKDILQASLQIFCKNSAADRKYCDFLKRVH